jgi:cytochrome c-type biogenesis protein CcmH/NrfF
MRILLLLLATTVIPPTPSSHQSERIVHLEDSLLAPCCYTQPVSKHMSDIAFDMRKEIGEMVLAGKSDGEIFGSLQSFIWPSDSGGS